MDLGFAIPRGLLQFHRDAANRQLGTGLGISQNDCLFEDTSRGTPSNEALLAMEPPHQVPGMLPRNEKGSTTGQAEQERTSTEMAVINPNLAGLHFLQQRLQQRALLGV